MSIFMVNVFFYDYLDDIMFIYFMLNFLCGE